MTKLKQLSLSLKSEKDPKPPPSCLPQAGSTQLPPDPLGRGCCANLIPSRILLATTGQVVTWTSQSCSMYFLPFAKPNQV